MLYFRPHKGGLKEAMEELKTFATFTELFDFIWTELKPWGVDAGKDKVSLKYYSGEDTRIGWPDTLLVCVEGYGVFGYLTHMKK